MNNRYAVGDKVDVYLDNLWYLCEVLEVPRNMLSTYVVALVGNAEVLFHCTENEMQPYTTKPVIKCDCGAHKVSAPGHSHWCSILDIDKAIADLKDLSY